MKILHIGKYFPPDPGGMETYLRDLMICCDQQGTRSVALVHHSRPGIPSSEEIYTLDHVSLEVSRVASWFKVLFTPISPAFPWKLHKLIKQHRPNILHLHLPNPSAFWVLALPSSRALPWVVQWQSDVLTPASSPVLKWFYQLYRPLETALLKRARRIIATSEPYRLTSPVIQGFSDKTTVIPLGIADRFDTPDTPDTPDTQKTVVQSQPQQSALKVIAVGRLAHYKGLDVLIKAVAESTNAELDIVGQGDEAQRLRRLTMTLGLESRVRFHGALSDAARDALLLASDCLCLPSTDRTESFGIVLLEAMSAGKACVITDVPGSGMTAVVHAGQTGLVVPPDDSSALAAALEKRRPTWTSSPAGRQGKRDLSATFHYRLDGSDAASLRGAGIRGKISGQSNIPFLTETTHTVSCQPVLKSVAQRAPPRRVVARS